MHDSALKMSRGGECCNRDFFTEGVRYAESRSVELSFHRHPVHPRFRASPRRSTATSSARWSTIPGPAVPNAKVIITDTSRAVSFTTTTNESGFFTQRFLIAGTLPGARGSRQLPRVRAGRERLGRPGNQSGRQAAGRRPERDGRGHRGNAAAENRAQRRGDHLQ